MSWDRRFELCAYASFFVSLLAHITVRDNSPWRFAAAVTLEGENRVARIAVRLRAVTSGSFELPGAELREMYRPGLFARQAAARITILP